MGGKFVFLKRPWGNSGCAYGDGGMGEWENGDENR